MKIIDEKETQKTPKKHKITKGMEAILKGWTINYFVVRLT